MGDDIEQELDRDKEFLALLKGELEDHLVLCYEPVLDPSTSEHTYCPLPENIIIKDVIGIVEDTMLKWKSMRDHEKGNTP